MQAIEARLLGGPAHGRVVRVPRGCTEWRMFAPMPPLIGGFWRNEAMATIDLRADIVTYHLVGAFLDCLLLTCDPAIAALARISLAELAGALQ